MSSIEHGPPREQFDEVYCYYTLAKRAEWQVRDLAWNDLPPIPETKGSAQKQARPDDSPFRTLEPAQRRQRKSQRSPPEACVRIDGQALAHAEPQGAWNVWLIHEAIADLNFPETRSKLLDVQPVLMTSPDLSQSNSWSQPMALMSERPKNVRLWSGFWVICDETKAHLLFSSPDGQLWRSETKLSGISSRSSTSVR